MGFAESLTWNLPESSSQAANSPHGVSENGTKEFFFFKNEPEKLLKTNDGVSK
jgi:hypothetical protein